jgi:hypothetical protein
MDKADLEEYHEFYAGLDDEEQMNLAKEPADPIDNTSPEWKRFCDWKWAAGVDLYIPRRPVRRHRPGDPRAPQTTPQVLEVRRRTGYG